MPEFDTVYITEEIDGELVIKGVTIPSWEQWTEIERYFLLTELAISILESYKN